MSLRSGLLAGLLVTSSLRAQTLDTPPRVESGVVVAASRLPGVDAGATVRVVTREEIVKIPARSVAELLRTLPGVDVRRRGVEGIQADIGIRGAGFNGTLFLVDGEPVNDPQSNHLSTDFDLPLDAVERIEVSYGGGSAVHGSDALGGVVNIVTRGAALGRKRAEVEARYARGTDSLDAGTGRVALKGGDRLSFALDGGRAESSGFREGTEFATQTLRLSGRYDTGRGPVDLTFGYAGREYGAYAFYGTRYPNQQETTRTRTARAVAELTFGGWHLSPSLAIRAHHDDYVLERENPAFYENRHDADRFTGRFFARHALLGGTALIGGEAGREAIQSTNLGSRRRDHQALFLEFGRTFAGGASGIRLGLRGDRYDDFGSRLSPHLSGFYSPAKGLTLRASFGTAFRVPTFTDLYYTDPQNLGNANLRPERATQIEVGARFDLGPFSLDAAGFHRQGTDLIDYVRSSPAERYEARNIRKADAYGVETTLEWIRLPEPLTRVALQASYLFTDLAALSVAADGATDGKYVLDPLHTKWDFIVGGTLPLRVNGHARLSYFSRPSFEDGVWLLEARLGYQLFEADGGILEVYGEGDNLGNVSYQELGGVPLPGRTLQLGAHLTW